MWFYLVSKYNWFHCDWWFECAEAGTKEILSNSVLQSSSRRGGKGKECPGQSLECTSVYPADLFGPQVESKPVQSRTQWGRCFNRGRGGARDVQLICWEYGWKEGGRRKCLAQESTAEKSSVLILIKNSPSIPRVWKRWIMPAIWHLANSSISAAVCLLCCKSVPPDSYPG